MILCAEPKTEIRPGRGKPGVTRGRVVPWSALDERLRSRWVEIQESNPRLDSPSFRPEYAEAIAAVRPQSELAVIESDGEVAGFFPYERGRLDIGYPIGGPLTTFQGMIVPADLPLSPAELLRDCGLSGWCFDQLVAAHPAFEPYQRRVEESSYIIIEDSFEKFRATHNTKQIKRWLEKGRKLGREHGKLRFELSTRDDAVLERLVQWKSSQYQRTDVADVFSFPWVREVVRRVHAHRDEEFAGMLSALYAGDSLVAAQLGIRTGRVMQGWFSAYNVDFSTYSPGGQLFLSMIATASDHGIRRIDMGRADVPYKKALECGSISIATGCISRSWSCRLAHETWPATRDWLKESSLQAPMGWLGRMTRQLRGRVALK